MALGSDDSGAFRVSAAGAAAKSEIRLPPAVPRPNAITPPSSLPVADPPQSGPSARGPLEIKPAANSQVRVTGLPPPRAAAPALSVSGTRGNGPDVARTTVVNPPRSIDLERWVRLPSGASVALRYARWSRRVSVSARKLEFPAQCPCCMQAADAEYEASVAKTRERQSANSWTLPYCAMCLDHLRRARRMRYGARAIGVVAALFVAAMAYFIGGLLPAVIGAGIAGLAAWIPIERLFLRRVAARMASSCACFGPAVRYAEFYGSVHHFDFASAAYADAFTRANEKKLV